MKKSIQILIYFLIFNSVFAVTRMGPPVSGLQKGQSNLSLEYSNGQTDIEIEGYGLKGTLEDIETDFISARIGIGMMDKSEIFFRFGAAQLENYDRNFGWGVGLKTTFSNSENLDWGSLFQINSTYASEVVNFGFYSFSDEVDLYEFQFAFGPSYHNQNLCLYGGPYMHLIQGNEDVDIMGSHLTFDLKQASEFGGYAGLLLEMDKNAAFNVEGQWTGDSHAIGIGFIFKFGKTSPDTTRKKRLEDEIIMTEKIDPNKKLLGYRVETDKYGSRIKRPVYEENQEK